MFNQAALLLLLAHAFSVETFKVEDHHIKNSKKIHGVLKNIVKRYFPIKLKEKKPVPEFENYEPDTEYRTPSYSTLFLDNEFRQWDLTSDEIVDKKRANAADTIAQALAMSTSLHDSNSYLIGMNMLRGMLDPEFFAEICDNGQQLNSYQYIKHLKHSADQYNGYKPVSYELLDSNRRSIHGKTKFAAADKNGLVVQFEFEFKAKLTFETGFLFSLIYLKQGGTCANQGKASMTLGEGFKDVAAEELQGLKTAPTTDLFFDLFTPEVYKGIKENQEYLPINWISRLNPSVVQINVCQEGVDSPQSYTVEEFRTWYQKFDIMWHRKAIVPEERAVQIIEMTEDSISARVTFRLQMGLDPEAPEEDWNFKFSGKKMDGRWVLNTVDVLCTPTVNYKDQSLKNIKDVVAARFIREIGYLNDTNWYFAPEFIRTFAKNGDIKIMECVKGIEGTPIKVSDLFTKDKTNKHGIKFTKYFIEDKKISFPAEDMMIYRFDTIGVPADSSSEEEQEYEWSYEVKWDQKDQFYYIVRIGIGCAKPWSVDKLFERISFVPKDIGPKKRPSYLGTRGK